MVVQRLRAVGELVLEALVRLMHVDTVAVVDCMLELGIVLVVDAAVLVGMVVVDTVADNGMAVVVVVVVLVVLDDIVAEVVHDSSFDPGSSRVACLDVVVANF